ncbi:hypothetical protein [Massilia aquatica]|uniref:Bacteriophage tail tape measure N-terminal domain-containing protein n=1 Tax=Massilia aquatica TaxID=2609000 RepID=A0ABX0M4X0_9BURK|nr:hypothetical protein [Massilia aquatica]NHZ40120.1 hypothetical protein [Massilia aquatica]
MSETTNNATIKVAVDAEGVEVGLRKIDDAAAKTGRNLDSLGKSDSAFAKIGAGGDAAAARVQVAAKTLAESVAATQAAMAEGGKASAAYYASIANSKGAPEAMKPLLAQIDALTAAEKTRAQTFSTGLEQTKSLFAIAGAAATTAQQQIAAMRLDSDQLVVPDEAIQSLKDWREAAAYAVGTAVGGGIAIAKTAFQEVTEFIKTRLIIAGTAAAIGISAAVLGATYAAYKTIDFAAGLLTGESYKSANIDALVAANKEVVDLQKNFRLSANEASGLAAALAGLGVAKGDYIETFREAGTAIKSNKDELDALGVKYKDAAGNLLPMRDVLVNVQTELSKYTEGLERNAVASALGFGSSEKIDAALSVTAEKLAAVTERQREYGLLISGTQQAEMGRYASVMAEFNVELDNTSQGFKRAIADNIMPALTNLADFFKEGWPSVVQGFRGGMAAFTSLFYGLKTVVDIVVESVKATFDVVIQGFGGAVKVFGNLIKGDFRAAAASLVEIWDGAMARFGKAGDKMVDYARANVSAIKLAWGQKLFPDELQPRLPELKSADQAKDAIKKAADINEQAAAYKKLSAVTADHIALLQAEATAGAKLSEGQRLAFEFTRELAAGKSKLTDEQKRERTAQIETQIALEKTIEKNAESQKAGTSASTAASAAASKQASEYANLGQAIQSKIAANTLELATSTATSESQKLGIKLDLELKSGKLKLTDAQIASTKASLAELAVTERKMKLQTAEKGVAEYITQNTLARVAFAATLASEYELYGQVSDARDLAAVGLRVEAELQKKLADLRKADLPISEKMIEQMRESAKARAIDERATLAQTKALGYAAQLHDENIRFAAESITDERTRAAELLEIDAGKWRARIALAQEGTESQKLLQQEFDTWYKNQSGKAAMDEWRKSVQQYDDIFRTGFADMLNNGQDGWKSFTKSLVTTFKTSVADQIYKMFIKPIVVQVIGNVVGGNGGAGGIMGLFSSSGGGAGGAGGGSQYVGLAQSASNAYEAIEKGFTGMSSQMGNMISTVGDYFGSSNISAFGNGMSMGTGNAANAANAYNGAGMTSTGTSLNAGATAGSAATIAMAWLAAAQIGRKIGNWISDGYSVRSGSNGNGFVNFTTLQSSVPILGGIVGGLINRAFGRRQKETTGSTLNGTFAADGGFAGQTDSTWRQKGGWFRSDKSGTDTMAVNDTSAKEFASAYSSIKLAAADFATVLGINAESIATRTQKISIAITKDEEATKKAITDFFVGVGNQIALELVPSLGEFTKGTETASETLQRVAGEYAFIDAALAAVGDTFGAVGVGSIKAREYLLELSGGMDAFGKDVAYFSQNYLTEAERLAPVAKAVEAAFADLQVAAPKTRAEFKALVMGLDLTSTNGAKTYAGLMNIQEAFAQLNPALEEAATKVRSAADIEKERAGLQDQFDQLALTPEAYRKKQLDKQRLDTDVSNRDLFDNVQYGIAADAANAAKKAAADTLAATNKGYQDQIDAFEKVGKKAAEVRDLEIAGMDATTVKLYDKLKAYQATATAAALAEQAAEKLKSVNSSYEDRIFEFKKPDMVPAKVREREIAGMDATTVRLYDELKALEAAKVAKDAFDRIEAERAAAAKRDQEELAREQARVAEEATRAAEQIKSAWQSVTDSIFDEVARIRGMVSGNAAQSLASVQTEFAIKNAQAQAGNQDAAKLLPSISQKLIELAEANATSLIDLQRIRARTAASLDATGAILAARFGLTLPSLAVGTNYLPADMMIQAHQGERVIPAADNRALMQMINRPAPADTSGAAQQQASNEMAGLRAEVRSIAISNAAMAGMLKRVIKDDKLQTEEA